MQETNQQLIPNIKACRDGPSLFESAHLREAMVKPEGQGDPPGTGEGGSHVKHVLALSSPKFAGVGVGE